MRYPWTVRTTLDLDDDVLSVAKQLAAQRGLSAGQVISDLVRQGLSRHSRKPARIRNGVPLFEPARKAAKADLALVNRLRDSE